jgi:hypothetical protein
VWVVLASPRGRLHAWQMVVFNWHASTRGPRINSYEALQQDYRLTVNAKNRPTFQGTFLGPTLLRHAWSAFNPQPLDQEICKLCSWIVGDGQSLEFRQRQMSLNSTTVRVVYPFVRWDMSFLAPVLARIHHVTHRSDRCSSSQHRPIKTIGYPENSDRSQLRLYQY